MNEQTIQTLNNHLKHHMAAQYNKDQVIYELAQLIGNVTTLPAENLSEHSKDTEYAAYETLASLLVYLQTFMSQLGIDPEFLNNIIEENLFEDGKEICRSNKGEHLVDELTLKHDGIEYCAKSLAPQQVTATVNQIPVDISIDCPFCEENILTSYEDFCAEHGDPSDWNYETLACPRCGAKLIIENQDWS